MTKRALSILITFFLFSLAIIVALAFVYFPRLRDNCTGIDWTNQEQIRLCEATGESNILLNSLSEIYPQAYWMAYVGIAASVSVLFYVAGTRTGVGEHRIFLRIIQVNIAIWYVMLPFTYDWVFWKQDGAVFPLAGGLLVTLLLGAAVAAVVHVIPFDSSWYRTGHGFGPDNLYVILIHLLFVLAAYIQWYRLVPAARRWWRKKRLDQPQGGKDATGASERR